MKICLLGEWNENFDEGMRNVSSILFKQLSKKHTILPIDLRNLLTYAAFKEIKKFNPDIIHYIHGPTIRSFLVVKLISLYFTNSKLIMSAMRPILPYYHRPLVRLLKPDVILTQSLTSEKMFKDLRITTVFFPSGVDLKKFYRISEDKRKDLKTQYNISTGKFVILHIGSIKEGRNLRQLIPLQDNETQVLIIGAGSQFDSQLFKDLTDAGCIVLTGYIQNIEKIYNCADCYVFPTIDKYDYFGRAMADSIEMPLTILEAMACNLPVISSNFGAIPRVFRNKGGFFLFSTTEELISALKEIKKMRSINTREMVISYSWENLTITLENIYAKCVKG